MALTKNNVNTFYENINVNFKRIERYTACSSSGQIYQKFRLKYEPLQIQKRLSVYPESRYCYKLWL